MGADRGGDGARDGAGVGDVDGALVGGDSDAVWLGEGIVDDVDGACGGAEAVAGGLKLGGCVG